MTLKIAAVTEDGERLSAHFGMAPYYKVFTVEAGEVVAEEMREKPHHTHHGHHHEHPGHNGHEHHHHHHHADMFAPIADCQVLLCGGMGAPAYAKAQAAGLEVVLMGGRIEDALQTYLRGEAVSDPRRIHRHR